MRKFTKLLWIMKLTAVLLLTAALHVTANGIAQKVTIVGAGLSLDNVIQQMQDQTGYDFFFKQEWMQNAHPVTVRLRDAPLPEALKVCFEGQPFTYSITDRMIIIRPSIRAATSFSPAMAAVPLPGQDIKGLVLDSAGSPVTGATVMVKGSRKGTQTDSKGYFVLHDLVRGDVIVISHVGYTSEQIKIKDGNNLLITLHAGGNPLDEVVLVGYGTSTQRFNVGSVSTVSEEEIARQPVTSPLEALEGKVPGLQIAQSNGLGGAQVNVVLRGQNSISSGTNPLYIIDGVPFDGAPVNTLGNAWYFLTGAINYADPLSTINPLDIQSISVLKDADATAIYGSRAANGVVLITTKRGKPGDVKVEVNGYTGWGHITRELPVLNLSQYLGLRRTAFANDGITPNASNAPDLVTWDTTKATDFQRKLIGNTAHQSDLSISVSGGEQRLHYLFSGDYHHGGTVLLGNFAFNRVSNHLSLESTSLNNRFNFSLSAFYSKETNNIPSADVTGYMFNLPPDYPLYTASGKLNWSGGIQNPVSYLQQQCNINSTNLLSNASLRYTILPGLNGKVSLGYKKITQTTNQYFPAGSLSTVTSQTGTANYLSNYTESYTIEPQLDYSRHWGKGRLSATVGGTWQQVDYVQPYMLLALGITSDELLSSLAAASSIRAAHSNFTQYKTASGFGRVNYIWGDRYIINVTARRDGSSRFGPDRRWGNFGSVGLGWIFTAEQWMKNKLPWLNYGKLRTSYGTVGNDQIGDYQYLATYSSTLYTYGGPGIVTSRIANPGYGWETTKKFELGLELGGFQSRVLLNVAWFYNRSDNMLVNAPLTPQTGFNSYTANLPATVQNNGWEAELKTINVKTRSFSWTTAFNITIANNKLVSFPGLAGSAYASQYVPGQPLNFAALYQYTGIKNGIPTVLDVNKDNVITPGLAANGLGDLLAAGSLNPSWYGGLSNSFQWRDFTLDVQLQYVRQRAYNIRYYNYDLYETYAEQPGAMANQDASILKAGFTPTTVTGNALATGYLNYTRSNGVLDNASFLRLKNISLSYGLSNHCLHWAKLSSGSLYVRAQNLFTITKYLGFDPETQGTSLPPLRTIIVGLNCSF